MAAISEYPLTNTGPEVQKAINDALMALPYNLGLKANTADVLTKDNTTAYTPTSDYHPATKKYVDLVRPTVDIGQTITGVPGTNASVSNTGTNRDAILNFTIPRGDTGAAAGFGTPTISVTALAEGLTPTASITASGGDTSKVFAFNFGIPKGDTGSQGLQGFYVGSIVRTSGTGAAGVTDTYTMYLNDSSSTAIGTFNVHNGTDGVGAGTVTSIGLANEIDNSLTISESPITSNGTIKIRHTNSVSVQNTQAFYPITIDTSGHISSYGQAKLIGDMFKSVYDKNDNGIVDGAESLNNGTAQIFFSVS